MNEKLPQAAQKPLTSPRPAAVKPVTAAPTPARPRDRWDWVIASFCISAGVVGLRVAGDSALWNELARGAAGHQPIGTLLKKKGGVRFRASESPLWHDVYAGSEQVSVGDTVFTANDGVAQLVLDDGSVTEIEPGSLVVVQRSADVVPSSKGWLTEAVGRFFVGKSSQSVLKIEQGTAKVALNKGQPPVKLQIGGKFYDVTAKADDPRAGSSAEITVDEKTGDAHVASEGNAQITQSGTGTELRLTPGLQAVLVENHTRFAVQKSTALQREPEAGEQLLLAPAEQVNFFWQWPADAAKDQPARIELEGPEKKSTQAVQVKGGIEATRLSLPQGAYRWRITTQAPDGKKTETPWRSFTVLRLAPPQAVGPLPQAAVSLPSGKSTAEVTLSWNPLPSGLQSEVELSELSSNGGKPTAPAKILPESAAGGRLKLSPGTYQWRVRSRSGESKQVSPWSDPSIFTVKPGSEGSTQTARALTPVVMAAPDTIVAPSGAAASPQAPAPVAIAPPPPAKPRAAPKPPRTFALSGSKTTTRLSEGGALDRVSVPLQWPPIEDAREYQVVVTDNQTHKTVATETTRVPNFDFTVWSMDTTRFTYQVTAVTRSGEKVISQPSEIEIQPSPPSPKMPAPQSQAAPGTDGSVLMTWERTVLTDSYRVQISEDGSFGKNVREETSARNLVSLKDLKPGATYYWRVQSVSGGHTSEWSNRSSFSIPEP